MVEKKAILYLNLLQIQTFFYIDFLKICQIEVIFLQK